MSIDSWIDNENVVYEWIMKMWYICKQRICVCASCGFFSFFLFCLLNFGTFFFPFPVCIQKNYRKEELRFDGWRDGKDLVGDGRKIVTRIYCMKHYFQQQKLKIKIKKLIYEEINLTHKLMIRCTCLNSLYLRQNLHEHLVYIIIWNYLSFKSCLPQY